MICIGAQTITTTLATIAIGAMTPEEIRTYVSINVDPWNNNEQINFKEPMGSLGVEYDIHKNIKLFMEHMSSPMQCNDSPGINHAGIKFHTPIGGTTLYSGISINNSNFDINDNFSGPLASIGVEYGDSYKFYTEYLTSVNDIENGRASVGFKVFFK